MSCYEWEQGEIVIPKGAWASFRKSLIKAHNDALLATFDTTCKAFDAAEEKVKGLRGDNRTKAFEEAFAGYFGGTRSQWGGFDFPTIRQGYGWDAKVTSRSEEYQKCLQMAFNYQTKEWTKPKKKDLSLFALTEDARIRLPDATIVLRNDSHTASWEVYENNRACDHARQHPLACTFFGLLAKIEWTRGSGGTIIGNDEYNRDSHDVGGGGNYIKETFGPNGKKAVESQFRFGY